MKRLIAGLALTLAASTAWAVPTTIGFDDGAGIQTGSISWAGGAAPLVGTNLDIFTTSGSNTPLNSGPLSALSCQGCFLNFQTGAWSSTNGALYQWLTGGTFSVTGSVWDGGTQIDSGNLLTGTFAQFTPSVFLVGGDGLFVANGLDTISQPLLDYFGEPAGTYEFATTGISLEGCTGGGGGFFCEATNVDIDNVAAVPTPGTGMLMLAGLPLLLRLRKVS